MKKFTNISGFSLIELTVVLVAVAIAMAVVMQSMTTVIQDTRHAETEREMEQLSDAIVGNPEQTANGTRSDFGYVGDVGVFPSNLNALRTNVGSMPTWNGPYIHTDYTQDTISYLIDGWGQSYSYNGGTTITSTGSGSNITKKLAAATTDYTRNTVTGIIKDNNGAEPGAILKDSVSILIDMPAGASGTVTKQYKPNSTGDFTLDSIPAGLRRVRAIYLPQNDTVEQYYTVLPKHKNQPGLIFHFANSYFTEDTSGSPTCTAGSFVLHVNGAGSLTEIDYHVGASTNWQAVDETVADDDNTYVYTPNGNYHTDVYTFTDSTVVGCTITSITVSCRAKNNVNKGNLRPTVYVGGAEYYSDQYSLTSTYTDYTTSWLTNPASGSAWTWADIVSLEAGVSVKDNGSAECRVTQVTVTVNYGP